MTTTRNPSANPQPESNRNRTFDAWALSHYKPAEAKLDLSKHSFFYRAPNDGPGHAHLDESFAYYLPSFMVNIGAFLDENPYIRSFSLNRMAHYWDPTTEMPQIKNNQRLHTLDLGFSGVNDADVAGLLDNPHLIKVDLMLNGLTNLSFKENKNLKTLYIGINHLNAEGIAAISRLENLETLNIALNKLNDELVGKLLNNLSHLKSLNLKHTNITSKTAHTLLKSTQLTDIHVSAWEVGFLNKFRLWRLAKKNAKREAELSNSKAALFDQKQPTQAPSHIHEQTFKPK